jgi:hypothetical protein
VKSIISLDISNAASVHSFQESYSTLTSTGGKHLLFIKEHRNITKVNFTVYYNLPVHLTKPEPPSTQLIML